MTGMACRDRTPSRRGSAIGHLISFSRRVPTIEDNEYISREGTMWGLTWFVRVSRDGTDVSGRRMPSALDRNRQSSHDFLLEVQDTSTGDLECPDVPVNEGGTDLDVDRFEE